MFAAAKDAKLYGLALKLAQKSPVDHRTLSRAAADYTETEPSFAQNCGLMALYWICAGRAFDVTTSEILTAYDLTLRAAEVVQSRDAALKQIRNMLKGFPQERLVTGVLARAAELWLVDPSV